MFSTFVCTGRLMRQNLEATAMSEEMKLPLQLGAVICAFAAVTFKCDTSGYEARGIIINSTHVLLNNFNSHQHLAWPPCMWR